MASREYLKDFTLVPASHEQMLAHARAAFAIWHKGQTFEWAFFKSTQREYEDGAWGKDGGLQAWVLVRRDDLSGEIYAGCEARKGQAVVSEGYMYAIASVVTPVQHLKKGYATHMLRLLHYALAEPDDLPPFPVDQWGPPPPALSQQVAKCTPGGIGSILWSDVGYKFYEKCTVGLDRPGWEVNKDECSEVVWKVLPAGDRADEGKYNWEWIYQKDIPALTEEMRAIGIQDLKQRPGDKTVYAPDPTSPGLLDWIQVRGPWLSQAQPKSPNQPYGLRTKTQDGRDSIVLFSPYSENIGKRLLITLAHNLEPDQLPSLLAKLDVQGAEAGRTEGWVWGLDLDSELVSAWKALPGRETTAGPRKEIDGHLLGIAWYGAEGDQGEFVERQMWDWC